MSTRETLTLGAERFRVGPWHADAATAHLTMSSHVARPSVAGLEQCLERLRANGYSSIITSALHPEEATSFLRAGFVEYDRLHVLSHDLRDLDPPRPPDAPGLRLRRGRRADRPVALAVDHAAFPLFWRLDDAGLDEALHATPRHRFRVGMHHDDAADDTTGHPMAGYAVTGRAGRQGFLQRLAVHPDRCGTGIGTTLVLDALRWAARHRATRVLVNTQTDNQRALDLYRRIGFEPTPTDLIVLTRPLP